jgi:hypothetical protein
MRGMDGSDADCESEFECSIEGKREMEMSPEDRKEMERVAKLQRSCTKPLVTFSPVAW